jgi:hypothetical protein
LLIQFYILAIFSEVWYIDTKVWYIDTEVLHIDTEVLHVDTEVLHIDTEVLHIFTEVHIKYWCWGITYWYVLRYHTFTLSYVFQIYTEVLCTYIQKNINSSHRSNSKESSGFHGSLELNLFIPILIGISYLNIISIINAKMQLFSWNFVALLKSSQSKNTSANWVALRQGIGPSNYISLKLLQSKGLLTWC